MTTKNISIVNAMALDSKISEHNYKKANFSSTKDLFFLEKLESKFDCIVRGSTTIKNGPEITKKTTKISNKNKIYYIVLSNKLDFNYEKLKFFNDKRKIVIFSKCKNKEKLEKAKKHAFIEKINPTNLKLVAKLLFKKYKFKKILVEGGGKINHSFLKNKLVDDIYLTICPFIVGQKSSNFVEGDFKKPMNLKLKKIEKIENELFLNYSIVR